MYLESIFVSPNKSNPIESWAIWSVVQQDRDNFNTIEVMQISKLWTDDDYITQEINRIKANPKCYFGEDEPKVRDVKKEANLLGQLLNPKGLIDQKTKQINQINANRHLKDLKQLWQPLDPKVPIGDLRLKGKVYQAKKKYLRVYALGFSPDVYIITGSGLKGTNRMEDDTSLASQLERLNEIYDKLKELGLDESGDSFFTESKIDLTD